MSAAKGAVSDEIDRRDVTVKVIYGTLAAALARIEAQLATGAITLPTALAQTVVAQAIAAAALAAEAILHDSNMESLTEAQKTLPARRWWAQ